MTRIWPLVALSIIPPALLYAASELWRPIMLERALLASGAALIGCWALGFVRLAQHDRRALAAIALPMLAAVLGYYYGSALYGTGRANTQHIELIQAQARPGDCIYHGNIASLISAAYYLNEWDRYVLPGANDLAQSLTESTKAAMGITEHEVVFDELPSRGCERVWLFDTDSPVRSDQQRAAFAAIEARYPDYDVAYHHRNAYVDFRVLLVTP